MENRKLLSWANWPVICKAQAISFIVGILIPIAITLIGIFTRPHDPLDLFTALWQLVLIPPLAIMSWMGLSTTIWGGANPTSWLTVILILLINSGLYCMLGTFIGLLIMFIRKKSKDV